MGMFKTTVTITIFYNDENDGTAGKSQRGILMYIGLTLTIIELTTVKSITLRLT